MGGPLQHVSQINSIRDAKGKVRETGVQRGPQANTLHWFLFDNSDDDACCDSDNAVPQWTPPNLPAWRFVGAVWSSTWLPTSWSLRAISVPKAYTSGFHRQCVRKGIEGGVHLAVSKWTKPYRYRGWGSLGRIKIHETVDQNSQMHVSVCVCVSVCVLMGGTPLRRGWPPGSRTARTAPPFRPRGGLMAEHGGWT